MTDCRIGLDILADVPGKSGQVNIHRNTLLWLPRFAPEWTFCVFATPRLQAYYESYGVGAPNLRWVMCWSDNTDGTLRRIMAQEIQLVRLAWRKHLDCLIAYPLPFLFPYLGIKTIYRHTLSPYVLKTDPINRYRRIKIKFSALLSDAVFCNSRYALMELERFVGCSLKRSAVIWEAFDEQVFSSTPPSSRVTIRPNIAAINDGDRAYLFVPSGLRPYKNPRIVFEMLAHFQQAGRALPRVVFAGFDDMAYAASLRKQYHPYFDDGTVKALGFCSHEEVAFLGRHATLAIYPSKIETFGVPPLEMMALGIPVVVSRAGPLPEISGPGAELFDPDNAEDLAHKVGALLSSSSDQAALSRRGAEFVKRYSWRRNAQETIAAIRSVLER